ncbi:cytochrome P450 [Suillus clintonianus]|uniref:cytochrome P450 n=1 Tax=Suillus clintonianus TaxID=1904413 RepID=UPI001B878B2B|nr:cytochrome P450 [Suillus clintonianus]KAG2135100.1 cytochrome P450 [Suillus clintonianus]
MIPPQSFFALITLQLPDLRISDNTHLFLSAAACLSVIGVIARVCRPKSERDLPLPPSPPTWRLGGHLVPPRRSDLTIAKWIDEYGPVITIRSKFQKIVFIGRYKAAVEIMENQGKFLADRPRMPSVAIASGGMGLTFAPFGEMFRRMRRALHSHLQPKAAEAYQPLQMSNVKNMVLAILNDPDNIQNHVLSFSATTITKIAYGKNTPTAATDPTVLEVQRLTVMTREILRPGSYLVDAIPWLRYLPWYGRDLKLMFKRIKKLHTGQLNRVKEQMHDNNEDIGPSFSKYMLENSHLYGMTETEMAYLSGVFFGAGTQTTSLAICTVLMAAACFPEEQAKVHAELDAVIGRHRVPTFADQKSLPLLQAFITEALRWRPSATGALPHRTTKDENYRIPAGTTVFGNLWSISQDPDVYPEPEAFKPQRWIGDQGKPRDDIKFFVFGFGRRVCPGQHVAERSVFMSALLILWAFRLTLDPTKPLDNMGYMIGTMPDVRPCFYEFEKRIPETELRLMLQNYPEAK